ncbi:MAG: ABC transporter substrate-binding protein [Bacteroidota bacterium]
MQRLTVALDWTPNVNHIGFFVAQAKHFYSELGLEVELLTPSADNYAITPAKKVELGQADFALCPIESVISYRTKKQPFDLLAIASLLQTDLSAIVVRKDSGITSPRALDGKIYSSYQARYEDGIVRAMVTNDGGKGDLKIIYPAKLGIWNTLLSGQSDATWIFLNWEGVQVEASAPKFRYFKMRDYQIPYSYSPVIAASASRAAVNKEAYRLFLNATKKGYLYCQEFPDEAVSILAPHLPLHDQSIDLKRALEVSAPHFGTSEHWGIMEETAVKKFLDWVQENGLEKHELAFSTIISNGYLA